MGLWESALILLGIGIVSSRFKAGVGLGELGVGIQTLVAAPLVGTGTGLSAFAGGIRDISETLGDLGRGFATLFESIPKLPELPKWWPSENGLPPPSSGNGLMTVSGGDQTSQLAGGGGNVPLAVWNGPYIPSPTPTTPPPGPTVIPNLIYRRNKPVMM